MSSIVGSLLPPAERPFGKYELIAKIATGGMAEILLAREVQDGESKFVVVKRVLPHLLDESRFIAMFRDEARLAAQLIHPNVCRVFDSGSVGHTHFIAMEYLHGVPLSRLLIRAARTKSSVAIPIAVGIVMQCAAGLHHAHELKSRDGRSLEVVHRDVSPPNILVTDQGVAKMVDFGVAKARGATQKTRTGTVKGKNSYMSPEQILGKEVDRRSDVFSLGVVLWESLTAKRLFSRETDFLTFTAITKADIPAIRRIRPEVSEELEAVVSKALAHDREKRYATCDELRLALAAAMHNEEARPAEIGSHIREAFSKELSSKELLVQTIANQQAAAAGENAESQGARHRPPTRPVRQATINLAIANPAAGLNLANPSSAGVSSEVTQTEQLERLLASNRRRLILPVFVASLLSAALVLYVSRGSQSVPAATTALADAQPVLLDAAVAIAPSDAAVPDAAPAVETPVAPLIKPVKDTRPAFLTIDSSPYATIFVDGKKLGVTPIFKAKLTAGKHRLKAVSATGAKKTMRLNLKPGRTKNMGRLRW